MLAGVAVAMLWSPPARAQDEVALPEPVATPSQKEGEPEVLVEATEIDLANVVTSAAKGVTTVQEAPAIITVITAEEIRNRGFRTVDQVLETVPGWQTVRAVGNQVELPVVRGVSQSVLLLHDGISLFDPWANLNFFNRYHAVENIKRLELVTGPGGVLWGANSYLGIVNVITKDAEDVNGIEASAGYGDGNGNKQDFRAYAMFGKTFLNKKLKIFAHASFESDIGEVYNLPQYIASTPAPQPAGPAYYGTNASFDPARSWFFQVDGKVSYGPVSLYWQIPVGEYHPQLTFSSGVSPNSNFNIYDRYAFLEYKDRFWQNNFGITAKGYYTQFVRSISVEPFAPSSLFPPFIENGRPRVGGLHFDVTNQLVQRAGGTVDFDLNLLGGKAANLRLLFGGESFYESLSASTTSFPETQDPGNLPVYCPQRDNGDGTFTPVPHCPRQFLNDQYRVVTAAYVDAQLRILNKLTLDGGARYQQGFGGRPYSPTVLGSAAIVWNFAPNFHLKGNYATGFRAPVYQTSEAALGGIEYGGRPDLKNETSESFQGELNARLLRNVRKVRELEVRVDYSYTFLDKLIQIRNGSYGNTGQRAIHSVEALAKLYLQGDHYLTASYTFLYSSTTDSGLYRATPNHWVSLGANFNVIKNTLDFNTNLLVMGASEDPNRYPTGRAPLGPCANATTGAPCQYASTPTTVARTTDLTFDRLTPVALLQLGFRLRFLKERLQFSGQFYNVLNQRYYSIDPFYDLTPTVELTPTPLPGFNFFASLSYRFAL